MNLKLHYSINFESGDSTDGIEYEAGIPDEYIPEIREAAKAGDDPNDVPCIRELIDELYEEILPEALESMAYDDEEIFDSDYDFEMKTSPGMISVFRTWISRKCCGKWQSARMSTIHRIWKDLY